MAPMSLEVIRLGPRKAQIGPYRLTRVGRVWQLRLAGKLVGSAPTLSECQTLVAGWDR